MSRVLVRIGRKILGLSLIFISLISLYSAINNLAGFYRSRPWWSPYSPYIIDGSILWVLVPVSLLNIAPARSIGRAKVGRIVFHHYVYGFLTVISATFPVIIFTPASLLDLFLPSFYEGT